MKHLMLILFFAGAAHAQLFPSSASRIRGGSGSPAVGECAAASDTNRVYVDTAAIPNVLYLCRQTSSGVFSWDTIETASGSLDADLSAIAALSCTDTQIIVRASGAWTCGTAPAATANPLSQFASTTSAQLAGVLSNETGTSLAVFNTNPTIVTPLIQNYTVAGLPSAGTAGRIAIVSDSSDGTCTSGSGSTWVWCRDTGSAWTAISSSGGSTCVAGDGITLTSGCTINADDANGKLPLANDGSTGTTLYYAVVRDSSNNGVKAATTDTSKVMGVCAAGCGTSGTATIVQRGEATLHSEGAVTRNQYVVISTSTAGAFASTATCPTDKQVLGTWSETQGSAGDWGAVLQAGLCVPAASGGGLDVTAAHRKWFDYCPGSGGIIGFNNFSSANSGGATNTAYAPSSNARAGCGYDFEQDGATTGNYVYVEMPSQYKWALLNEKNSAKFRVTMTPLTDSGQDLGFLWNSTNGADFTDTHDRISFVQASSTSGGYSGFANTTAWHIEVCASSACVKTNTAVAVTAGVTYALSLSVTGATTADWQIRAWTNDGSVTETTGSLTGLTWPTGAMQPYAVVINRNATANHSFRMHSGVIEWQQ